MDRVDSATANVDTTVDEMLEDRVRAFIGGGVQPRSGSSTTLPAATVEELLESLTELGGLLLDEAGVDEAVTTVLDAAVRTLGGSAHAVSLTVSELEDARRSFVTRDATSDWARELDEWQYVHGEGPCLAADESGRTCVVRDCRADERFPRFNAAALELGVEACVSYPMLVRGRSLGSINVCYRDRAQLEDAHVEAGERLALSAAPLLANWLAHGRMAQLVDQLRDALDGRGTIERAKGLLMGRLGVDADRAFELLVTQSNHENRRVRQVAAELVAEAG